MAGRSTTKQHRRQAANEEAVGITMSVDYALKIAEGDDEKTAPVSVANEHKAKSLWVLEVDHKGVDSGIAADWLVEKLQVASYGGVKVTLKSDNEASIIALKTAFAVRRKAETALIESPVRESQSNGHVERAVRTWRDQYRTMRHCVEHRMKRTVSNGSPFSTWLVTWAADVINDFRVQDIGRTAYEL